MTRPSISRQRGALVCAMLFAMATLAGSAWADSRTFTSSTVIPLRDSSVLDSYTGSRVNLQGWVHIVTTVTYPVDPILPVVVDAYVNMPAMDVVAVNENPDYANLRYLAYGAANTTVEWTDPNVPPNPVLPYGFELRLLSPNSVIPNGVPPNPVRFRLALQLVFDALGDVGQSYAYTVD